MSTGGPSKRIPARNAVQKCSSSGPRAIGAASDVKYTKPTKPDMPAVAPSDALDDVARDRDIALEGRPTAYDPLSSERRGRDTTRRRAALIAMMGPTAGQAFVVTCDRATRVGRSRDADIKIDEEGVSRDHAALAWEAGQVWITDLGSRNGTTVDEQLISRCPLSEGAEVRFGARTLYRFAFLDEHYEALLRQLYDSSVRDPLTGAYNRQYFDRRLRGEIAYAARHGTNVALCMIDLDHFKRVNDAFGHPAGDAVLRYVGAVAQSRLRNEDVFARYGGEEFGVILRGIEIDGAGRAAERLRGAIGGSAVTHDGRLIPVTISAGCATLRCCSGLRPEDLISAADRRLYLAKVAGRNRIVTAD